MFYIYSCPLLRRTLINLLSLNHISQKIYAYTLRSRNWMDAYAQCPMPNAQCPIHNAHMVETKASVGFTLCSDWRRNGDTREGSLFQLLSVQLENSVSVQLLGSGGEILGKATGVVRLPLPQRQLRRHPVGRVAHRGGPEAPCSPRPASPPRRASLTLRSFM